MSENKLNLIITDKPDASPSKDGIMRFSNHQWSINPSKLEGYEFNDVIVNCRLDDKFREWLHMHIGIRINRIIYNNPLAY